MTSGRKPARIQVREYGGGSQVVVLLHGGPGAGGYLAPLARELAGRFRVLEPLQRSSGAEPLTVALHVADLYELVQGACGQTPPALVGHSWGAMLGLAFAAAHPDSVRSLVLIACGTFDAAARAELQATVEKRLDDDLRRRLERLPEECPDPDDRLRLFGDLLLPLYSCDPLARELDVAVCDARGHTETWQDLLRLQVAGVYPAAFASIGAPVLMLHGALDPHPGRLVRASLQPHLPQLEYLEWARCGHYPWLERGVREEFLDVLRRRLAEHFARTGLARDRLG